MRIFGTICYIGLMEAMRALVNSAVETSTNGSRWDDALIEVCGVISKQEDKRFEEKKKEMY